MTITNTCRFCGEWKDDRSQVLKYGVRHYAHMQCLSEHGRLEELLRRMPQWQLGQLRYFELKDLGLLDLVRSLATEGK